MNRVASQWDKGLQTGVANDIINRVIVRYFPRFGNGFFTGLGNLFFTTMKEQENHTASTGSTLSQN